MSVDGGAGAHHPVLKVRSLRKIFPTGSTSVVAVDNVDIEVSRGEYLAVMGPSGSGKSTFMNLIGCLDQPTSGSIELNGIETSSLDPEGLAVARSEHIGFVFQQFNLLPRQSALENVALPLIYRGLSRSERERLAAAVLTRVGLGDRLAHKPGELSGGQQQRTAIARALVGSPSLLLADEPTGALDSRTSREIMNLFAELNRDGVTVIMVTHDAGIAAMARRTVHFIDGAMVEEVTN